MAATHEFQIPPDLRQTTDFWDMSKYPVTVQRAGRYVPDRKDDPESLKAGRTWPYVAGAIIDTYSEPGHTVLDPMAGVATTLVEACWRRRYAIGYELEEARWQRGLENLALGDSAGAGWRFERRDSRALPINELLATPPNLVVVDPPFGETRQDGGRNRFGNVLHNYTGEDRIKHRASRNQSNIGNMKLHQQMAAITLLFGQCFHVAADGAYMAVLSKDYRKQFDRIDLFGYFMKAALAAGWSYYDRATIYLGNASHTQRRNANANGNLLQLTQDLLVFRKGR